MPLPNQFSLNFNSIRIALINALEAATTLTAIVEEPTIQGAPRPPLPYMSMKIITPSYKTGDDSSQYNNLGTQFNRGGQRRMTVSFHCYAQTQEDAYNYMALWQSSLETLGIQEILRRSGIAVWIIGTVADLSQLLNTGYEGRSQMDTQFGIAANITEDLGEIDTVEITARIITDSGDPVEESFTVVKS